MEGTGFEPTVEALFGKNGFFPDTVMKTMYFVSENMPVTISEILQKIMPALRRDRMRVHRAICPVKINTKKKHKNDCNQHMTAFHKSAFFYV